MHLLVYTLIEVLGCKCIQHKSVCLACIDVQEGQEILQHSRHGKYDPDSFKSAGTSFC